MGKQLGRPLVSRERKISVCQVANTLLQWPVCTKTFLGAFHCRTSLFSSCIWPVTSQYWSFLFMWRIFRSYNFQSQFISKLKPEKLMVHTTKWHVNDEMNLTGN